MNSTHQHPPGTPSGEPSPKVVPERTGPVQVEMILVGRGLVRGNTADTNGRTLAHYFTQRAANVRRLTLVGDDRQAVAAALREAFGRNPHLVVSSGGLGPAADDLTLAAVAEALQLPLALNHEAKTMVEAAYQRLRRKKVLHKGGMTVAREKMCELPVGSEPVPNPVGIAPGVICRLPGGAVMLCLPGQPEEMQAVLEAAMPRIRVGISKVLIAQRKIESPTADESALRPLLDRLSREFPDIWINSVPANPRKPGTKAVIHLEATGSSQHEADTTVDGVVRRLLALAAGSP